MEILFLIIAFCVAYPFVPAIFAALVLLYLIVRILKWTEGPSPDYDDSENSVGRPL